MRKILHVQFFNQLYGHVDELYCALQIDVNVILPEFNDINGLDNIIESPGCTR